RLLSNFLGAVRVQTRGQEDTAVGATLVVALPVYHRHRGWRAVHPLCPVGVPPTSGLASRATTRVAPTVASFLPLLCTMSRPLPPLWSRTRTQIQVSSHQFRDVQYLHG